MSKTRTPENFPRMKVRGGRRRKDAQITKAWRTALTIDWDEIGSALRRVGETAGAMVASIERFAATVLRNFRVATWLIGREQRDRWVASHQLPAAPSPYAAPIRK